MQCTSSHLSANEYPLCCLKATSVLLFFQAEDGIRVYKVTGVQTCALPILLVRPIARGGMSWVYEAVDLEQIRPAAVKILAPTFAGNVRACHAARREPHLMQRMRQDRKSVVQGKSGGADSSRQIPAQRNEAG